MGFALLVVLALQESADAYYKFPKGKTWIYEMAERGRTRTMTLQVVREEDGRVYLESTDGSRVRKLSWHAEDGYLVMSEERKGRWISPLRVLKFGSRKGETWKSPEAQGGEFDVENLGTESLEVPAGKYEVTHVRLSRTLKMGEQELRLEFDYFLAPKVGMVRMETRTPEKTTLVLQEIK